MEIWIKINYSKNCTITTGSTPMELDVPERFPQPETTAFAE
jgi:hypothetical protein